MSAVAGYREVCLQGRFEHGFGVALSGLGFEIDPQTPQMEQSPFPLLLLHVIITGRISFRLMGGIFWDHPFRRIIKNPQPTSKHSHATVMCSSGNIKAKGLGVQGLRV